MNKLLFDLVGIQPTPIAKRHGGGKYGEIIFRRILDRNLKVFCYYDSKMWINSDIMHLVEENHIELIDKNNKTLLQVVIEKNIDIVYVPALINSEHLQLNNCHVIGTIHDLRPLEKPLDYLQMEYKPWNNVYRFLLKCLFKKLDITKKKKFYEKVFKAPNFSFVTVSQHSRYAFKCYFPDYKHDIPVFYSPSTSYLETKDRKYEEKYFLIVSVERFYKNGLRAIKALDKLFSCGYAKDFKVKITGVKGAEVFWYKIKNKEKFEFLGFVDEQDLDQLYHDAYCFIYPTFSEGFGYPPLEAMHYGVPVLSSSFTAIPEVCGGNVIYFNPFSVEEIMNRILQILDEGTRRNYSMLSKERYEYITQRQNEDLDKLIDYIYNYRA